jgi:hypothetical protein
VKRRNTSTLYSNSCRLRVIARRELMSAHTLQETARHPIPLLSWPLLTLLSAHGIVQVSCSTAPRRHARLPTSTVRPLYDIPSSPNTSPVEALSSVSSPWIQARICGLDFNTLRRWLCCSSTRIPRDSGPTMAGYAVLPWRMADMQHVNSGVSAFLWVPRSTPYFASSSAAQQRLGTYFPSDI